MLGNDWNAIAHICCNCKYDHCSGKCLKKNKVLADSEKPSDCSLFEEKEWGLPISQRIEFSTL